MEYPKHDASEMTEEEISAAYRYWRRRIFITIWLTYGSYYFCRSNISAALPGIRDDLGINATKAGMILTAIKLTYALGQFVNGQLGDRFGARRLMTLGMIASVAVNIMFGFGQALWFLVFIWALNGYFQSTGWPPSVKTIANWFPLEGRGTVMGVLGTCYQVGSAAILILSGYLVDRFGWSSAFHVPAVILLISAIHFYTRVRNTPEDAGLPDERRRPHGGAESTATADSQRTGGGSTKTQDHPGIYDTLRFVLTSPRLWIVALAFCGLDMVRYGFLDWAPTHLHDVQGATIGKAAFKAAILPFGGCLGTLVAGWLTDRFFQSRRAPVVCIMLLFLGALTLSYHQVVLAGTTPTIIYLGLIGFMTYGPHVLMVGTIPQDFGTKKAAASAAGFIDCCGYLGAGAAGVGTGWLIDNYGWHVVLGAWSAAAFVAGGLMAILWAVKPTEE